jgi:hypothetical protein
MTIKSVDEMSSKREIDLTGPDGNAFVLLGIARSLGEQLEYDVDKIHAEMTSGDYDNLVETFDKYFGDFVTLYR